MPRTLPLWLYLAGLTINLNAQWIARTGILIWVYSLTQSAPAVSLVGVMEALPLLVTAPIAGVLVDRLPYREVLVAGTALQALVALPLLLAQGKAALPLILAVTVMLGVLAQVFGTAAGAIMPSLAGPAGLGWVNGANQLIAGTVMALAPGAASAAVWLLGERGLVLALVTCWLAGVVVLWGLPAQHRPGRGARTTSAGAEMRLGLSYTLRTPMVRDVLVVAFIGVAASGGMTPLFVIFATRALHLQPSAGGILIGAVGAGQLVGGILAMIMASRLAGRYHRVVVASFATSGVCLALFAIAPSLVWAVPILIVRGCSLTLSVVSLTTLVQLASERSYLGRVFSLFGASLAVAQLLSYSLGGVLAQMVGVRQAVGLASAIVGCGSLIAVVRIRWTPSSASPEPVAGAVALAAE